MLRAAGTRHDRENLTRFGIMTEQEQQKRAFGVSMAKLKAIAKRLGKDHELAASLWATGWYEARMLAALVDDPDLVTGAQMDRWAKDFDNWGICDTVCFCLFDRVSPELAFQKVSTWCARKTEFVRRGGLALLASLALHDKVSSDAPFLQALSALERAITEPPDDRHLVQKGASWAVRGVGRRNARLHKAAVALAKRLADSDEAPARWIGKDALRELESARVVAAVARRSRATSKRAVT